MSNSRQNNDYIRLRRAITNKNKIKAQNLIRNNVNVNDPIAKGDTLLHLAIIKFEDVDIMTLLLDRGVNIHATNDNNEKPLDVAIQNNKTKAAILLIERGALVGEDVKALLLKTIKKNNHIIFKSLIDNRTQHNRIVDFKTLFNIAMSRGCAKILEETRRHCRFSKPSDKYIPKEVVIKPRSKYKKCVELLLKWKFTIDPYSNHDNDFIYAAVENGHLGIVLQLLQFGIDVNLVNSDTGLSLLKVACLNSHHEIVENLLKHNACVNLEIHTNHGTLYNPLYKSNRMYGYMDSLLSSYNMNDLDDLTCLHIAVLNSHSIITKLLLKHGAKIIDDQQFFKVTCIAVRINCEEIVRIFLDRGIDVNDVDPQGRSLLHFCAFFGCDGQDGKYNIAKLFLEEGAVSHIQIPGNSLTFEAVKNGHHKIAQLFLDYNANIQYISEDGDTLLHKAIKNGFNAEFIRTLLKRNSPVDVLNNNMYTPLLVACKTKLNNQFEIIKTLLNHNANVNCPVNILSQLFQWVQRGTIDSDDRGQTPLHFVCNYKSDMTESIIKLLLEHNANIEAVDAKGWTPLFVACKNHNDIAVKCLLDHHANANRTDYLNNHTPLYIAVQFYDNNSEVINILLKHKVNVHYMDKQGKSIIHMITRGCKAKLIKNFVHTRLNFNSVDKEGNTPLHAAVEYESMNAVENLIKYGADINILDKKNQTPLQNAVDKMSMFRRKLDDYRDRRDNSPSSHNSDSDDDDYDTDFYYMDSSNSKVIMNILKIQVVKLNTAGLKVNKQNFHIVYNSDYHNDNEFSDDEDMDYKTNVLRLEAKCAREIENMRTESIGINDITLYSLLQNNVHFMTRFVNNKTIRQTLELEVYDKKFPLYIDIIRSRFRNAKLRYKLINVAKKYFNANINQRLSDDCVDAVFSYLNLEEIKMVIRAMKPEDKLFYL